MMIRLIKRTVWIGLTLVLVLGLVLAIYLGRLNNELPPVTGLEDPDYSLPTLILDRHGRKVDEIYIKRRKLVIYDQLPPHLINGLIAKEDSRFFEHHGIDPLRMIMATWVNMIQLRKAQGASTLTQQTARQFFLTLEKTWSRKLKEILLALKIEREFSKEEIITLYLNKVNFGDAWGVSAAAEVYFNKDVEHLTLAESAVLVGLLPAPNRYKPTRSLQLAREQRNVVLARMMEEGFITPSEFQASSAEPIMLAEVRDPGNEAAASYVEYVRRLLLEEYGSKSLYEGGLSVYMAMDLTYQTAAHQALVDGVRAIDRRRGYRGSLETQALDEAGGVPEADLIDLNPGRNVEVGKIMRGIVTSVDDTSARVTLGLYAEGAILWEVLKEEWPAYVTADAPDRPLKVSALTEILKPGAVILTEVTGHDPFSGVYTLSLYQEPEANGGVYALNPQTGEVLAMVGGLRFGRTNGASEFIRPLQAERQPGSAFKPIIYAAAIEEGYTPATVLDDSPRVFTLNTGRKHTPQNYDHRFLGRVSLRESLVRSRNVPTVQLVDEMGARNVIEYARKFGLTGAIPEESIIALGTHSVKLSELTGAYGVFPAGGKLATPIYVLRIEDAKGQVLFESKSESRQVISEDTAYLISDVLQDVVRSPMGTAHRAMEGFTRPAGGKTGTTQDYTDAWYIGFIPQLASGIYVGFDAPSTSLGPSEAGSTAAAPIWKEFMSSIEGSLPIETFKQPESVVTMRVDREGQMLAPCQSVGNSRYELFRAATVPKRLRDGAECLRPVYGGGAGSGGTGTGGTAAQTPSKGENVDL